MDIERGCLLLYATLTSSWLAVKPITVFRLSFPVNFYVCPIDVVPEMVSSGVMDGKKH